MKTILLIQLFACLYLAASQAVIQDPPEFTFKNNKGILQMGQAWLSIQNLGLLSTRAYRDAGGAKSYGVPGPTIRMDRTQTYRIVLSNALPYQDASTKVNDYKDNEITNLHTHGLHVSGESPQDDVMKAIQGGKGAVYEYSFPDNQLGGTLWYHAHHHGSSWLQLIGGAAGALIIKDDPVKDGIPLTVTKLQERVFVITKVDVLAAKQGTQDTILGLSGNVRTNFMLVNGQFKGVIKVPKNTWQRWRVVMVDEAAVVHDFVFTGGSACEVVLLQKDGIWRRTVPQPLIANTIKLTGATRVDFGVRCSASSTITYKGVLLATISVDTSLPTVASTVASPYDATGQTWNPIFPNYLKDLRGLDSTYLYISLTLQGINDVPFNMDVPTETLTANTVYEMDLEGTTDHPFHMHAYPVQVVTPGGCGNDFVEGEFYDTISGNIPVCTVRFNTSYFGGKIMIHCHVLRHEDKGVMGWFDVTGGWTPSNPNDGNIFNCAPTCTATSCSVCNNGVCYGGSGRFLEEDVGVIQNIGDLSMTTSNLSDQAESNSQIILNFGLIIVIILSFALII